MKATSFDIAPVDSEAVAALAAPHAPHEERFPVLASKCSIVSQQRELRTVELEIAPLASFPDAVPTVARWWFEQWGQERPESSLAILCDDLRSKLDPASLPLQLLAMVQGHPVGVGVLKPYEMQDAFPRRGPWLGSLYVRPDFRGRGIGQRLVLEIERAARARALQRLYLQTEQLHGGLYARLGWERAEELDYRGYRVLVMTKRLEPEASGTADVGL